MPIQTILRHLLKQCERDPWIAGRLPRPRVRGKLAPWLEPEVSFYLNALNRKA
jgi:hypothetical protein